MIVSLDLQSGQFRGATALCTDHSEFVDRIMSDLEQYSGSRVQAAYSAAVLSISVDQLLRRPLLDSERHRIPLCGRRYVFTRRCRALARSSRVRRPRYHYRSLAKLRHPFRR